MSSQKLHTSGQTIAFEPANLDTVEGFATAHIEQLKNGKRVVVGTFKGERTFHDAHKGTSARMIYRGLVKDEGVLFRVGVRGAKFKSVGAILAWEELEND